MEKEIKLSMLLQREKVLVIFLCSLLTIASIVVQFCPLPETDSYLKVESRPMFDLPPIFLVFSMIFFDVGFYFCFIKPEMRVDLETGYFISLGGGGLYRLAIPLSEIKQLQLHRDPDSMRFYIEVLLHDGTVKRINWNIPRLDTYEKQKGRCTEFIEKCNAILPEYQKKENPE